MASTTQKIWIKDKEHAWLLATVVRTEGEKIVATTADGAERTVKADDTLTYDPSHSAKTEDCASMNQLSEAPLVDLLRRRFLRRDIHTYVADVVIAVNPYKFYPSLNKPPSQMRLEEGYMPGEDPHVWAVADVSYANMQLALQTKEGIVDQSVLVSGESGAGKTEACKNVMRYLTLLSGQRSKALQRMTGRRGSVSLNLGIEQRVMACSPFLEAFGNAKTTRNDNSSRFGKYLRLQFNNGRLIGADLEDYLLEKVRVTHQGESERNYHIFYFLLMGASDEERAALHLEKPEAYRYLGNRYEKVTRPDGSIAVDDVKGMDEVRQTLGSNGVNGPTQASLWSVLAAVLTLGNIDFNDLDGDDSQCAVANMDVVATAAKLLGVPAEGSGGLAAALCIQVRQVGGSGGRRGGSVYRSPISAAQASASRDSLAKMIYDYCFSFVCHAANVSLSNKQGKGVDSTIGILDIFGFEIFKVNSFEQLCINYANEMLQNVFNEHVFKHELVEYKAEALPGVQGLSYVDNAPCCDLIGASSKKFNGVLAQLDDQASARAAVTDQQFGEGLVRQLQDKGGVAKLNKQGKAAAAHFEHNKRWRGAKFGVRHFAGSVVYTLEGFIEKNKDSLFPHLRALMTNSTKPFVKGLFSVDWDALSDHVSLVLHSEGHTPVQVDEDEAAAEGKKKKRKKKKKKTKTIASKFKAQLRGLVRTIKATEPHFVRCVKPNNHRMCCDDGPKAFDAPKVLEQLRFSGVMQFAEIRKRGFPFREPFEDFLARMKSNRALMLLDKERGGDGDSGLGGLVEADPKKACEEFMTALFGGKSGDGTWASGNTKIFGKDRTVKAINVWVEERIGPQLSTLQKLARATISKAKLLKLRAIEEERKRREAEIEAERKRKEAARLAERKRKEEEKRKAREEAERKRKEEADRLAREAAEKKRREEEEERRQKEELARLEADARKKREEEIRIAAEKKKKEEEEEMARKAAEQKAREEKEMVEKARIIAEAKKKQEAEEAAKKAAQAAGGDDEEAAPSFAPMTFEECNAALNHFVRIQKQADMLALQEGEDWKEAFATSKRDKERIQACGRLGQIIDCDPSDGCVCVQFELDDDGQAVATWFLPQSLMLDDTEDDSAEPAKPSIPPRSFDGPNVGNMLSPKLLPQRSDLQEYEEGEASADAGPLVLKKINHTSTDIGKGLFSKKSKKAIEWTFLVNGKLHEVVLKHSITSKKKRVFVNDKLVKQTDNPGFISRATGMRLWRHQFFLSSDTDVGNWAHSSELKLRVELTWINQTDGATGKNKAALAVYEFYIQDSPFQSLDKATEEEMAMVATMEEEG